MSWLGLVVGLLAAAGHSLPSAPGEQCGQDSHTCPATGRCVHSSQVRALCSAQQSEQIVLPRFATDAMIAGI